MIPAAAYIKKRIEICGLPAAGQHSRRTALQLGNLRRHMVVCRVLQSGVEITAGL